MSARSNSARPPLWQPISLHHEEATESFVVTVPPESSDLLPFIAEKFVAVSVPAGNRSARVTESILLGISHPVAAAVTDSLLRNGRLRNAMPGEQVPVFCVSAVLTPTGEVGLLCATEEPSSSTVSEELAAAARDLVGQHRAGLARLEGERTLGEIRLGEMIERAPGDSRDALREAVEKGKALSVQMPPSLDARPILHLFPPGLIVGVGSGQPADAKIQKQILANPFRQHPPPRRADYRVTTVGAGHRQHAFVTWVPHRGGTPYPEVKAAVERRLPRALSNPRASQAVRPDHAGLAVDDASSQVNVSGEFDALADEVEVHFAFDFPEDVARSIQERLRRSGLDAIGWYAAWHSHTENAWGIYIDAKALDELACSLSEDLKHSTYGRRDDTLASKLAFQLVYRHESFHALLEAVLTWSELQALRPIYQRYSVDVSAHVRGTDDCLEEALANFWVWTWLQQELTRNSRLASLPSDRREGIADVVAAHLSLSPPGYRRWREGSDQELWRTLATHAIQSRLRLPPPGNPLPLEALLVQRPPFELLPEDIPLRFVGTGRIASAVLSRPSTMRLPSRAELREVITKHFRYGLVAGAGKGSHEKYRSADGRRSFTLPTSDPVSPKVFSTFLHHFNLTKAEYLVLTGRIPASVLVDE